MLSEFFNQWIKLSSQVSQLPAISEFFWILSRLQLTVLFSSFVLGIHLKRKNWGIIGILPSNG